MSGIITSFEDEDGRVVIRKRKRQSDKNLLRMMHSIDRSNATHRIPGEIKILETITKYVMIAGDSAGSIAIDSKGISLLRSKLTGNKKNFEMDEMEGLLSCFSRNSAG